MKTTEIIKNEDGTHTVRQVITHDLATFAYKSHADAYVQTVLGSDKPEKPKPLGTMEGALRLVDNGHTCKEAAEQTGLDVMHVLAANARRARMAKRANGAAAH